ncbi:MAG: Nif3-like dinuclear metal center hexameric protein [Janthinobacterium lividum]
MKISEILVVLQRLAPEESALEGDPIGMLVECNAVEVSKVGVCLDATPAAVQRAAGIGAELVIAHHPLIYHPLKRISTDPVSTAVKTLVKNDIALYAMHTNWDLAPNGINDTLAECLELSDVNPLGTEGLSRLPRLGTLACPRPLADFARFVEAALGCAETSALRVSTGDPRRMISRVAVCGGAGAELAEAVRIAGADAYVTSDVRHHEFWEAEARGLALVDAGHCATETPGMRALVRTLPGLLSGVEVVWIGD